MLRRFWLFSCRVWLHIYKEFWLFGLFFTTCSRLPNKMNFPLRLVLFSYHYLHFSEIGHRSKDSAQSLSLPLSRSSISAPVSSNQSTIIAIIAKTPFGKFRATKLSQGNFSRQLLMLVLFFLVNITKAMKHSIQVLSIFQSWCTTVMMMSSRISGSETLC